MERLSRIFRFIFKKHQKKTLLAFLLLFLLFWFSLPSPLFNTPYSFVLEDAQENLLGARIAKDGQWRFPMSDKNVPDKFKTAIIEFEDRRFESHIGIDFKGILRAIEQNFRNGKIVSGGSTISMQVIRLARGNRSRNIFQKIIETILALRMELTYSKEEILSLYAAHAPFGGNVVGLETAAWRYYGKKTELLTWSEAATLAVLPNTPALIHPGRNRAALRAKRNRLLTRILEHQAIDSFEYQLALEEPLPEKPLPLPRLAPHLQVKSDLNNNSFRVKTTLDTKLQERVNNILKKHQERLSYNEIHNACALVVEVETGNILAYVGNVIGAGAAHGEQVDVIPAPRSTGSILKPFLYALALDEGLIAPSSLLQDVPAQLGSYRPVNYHENYDGLVEAKRFVIRSLNVPAVNLLSDYGLQKFHYRLKKMGMTTLNHPAEHYGLPLVLGGAEGSLFDIVGIYASMARTLNHFSKHDGQYNPDDFSPLNYSINKKNRNNHLSEQASQLSASACWQTFETMRQVERPNTEGDWEQFASQGNIAWKTGTSFGFRDAWAVGLTPKYVVGVWAGNADGEGRPGLVGVKAAAPILFDIFSLLKKDTWFEQPIDEMQTLPICSESGYRPLANCPIDSIWACPQATNIKACHFHQQILLDSSQSYQVNRSCYQGEIITKNYFVPSPIEAHYYQYKQADFETLPSYLPACKRKEQTMQLIYPQHPKQIYVPVEIDGTLGKTVFRVAHQRSSALLYWHLDETYIGSTDVFHEMALQPTYGKHRLTIVDAQGNRIEQEFEILRKD